MIAALMIHDYRSISLVASTGTERYGSRHATAKSVAGTASPFIVRSTSSHIPVRSFFSPALYGGAVREAFAPAGSLTSRSCRPAQRYHPSSASDVGSSSTTLGAVPMHALIPSKVRVLAHRRMALSALRANSSLSVRLKRFNHHMDRARALENAGGMQ